MASAERFVDEMGSNPLGNQFHVEAVGPYVVEAYDRGMSCPLIIIWRFVPDEIDRDIESRPWNKLAMKRYDAARGGVAEVRTVAPSLDSEDAIEAFVERNSDDD